MCVICDKNKIDKRGAVGAPDLIVEILSPSNSKRDLYDKLNLYEEAKIKEYWIVRPYDKSITIYVLNKEGKYMGLKPFTEDGNIQSTIFEGLQFELKAIFNFSI